MKKNCINNRMRLNRNKKFPLEKGQNRVKKAIKCSKFLFLTTRRREQREKKAKKRNLKRRNLSKKTQKRRP